LHYFSLIVSGFFLVSRNHGNKKHGEKNIKDEINQLSREIKRIYFLFFSIAPSLNPT